MNRFNCIVLFCFSFFLLACSKDEESSSQAFGYLTISEMNLTYEGESRPLTKAVDEVLRLEICQNGEVVAGQSYEAGSVPERIALSPGTYLLKAFSAEYDKEPENESKGIPVYYDEYPFTISTGDDMTIELTIPLRNIGILFAPSEEFKQVFPVFSLKVEALSRSYTFNETNYGEAAYFNLTQSGSINYALVATNTDGEVVGPLLKSIELEKGTIYTLALEIE